VRSSSEDPKWKALGLLLFEAIIPMVNITGQPANLDAEQMDAFRQKFFESYLNWLFKYSGEFIICHDLSKNIRV
jgi:hypothetical protein